MIVRRIEIEDFRSLSGLHVFALGEGLNLVHGPNEAGKTTLLEALKCGLTLKAKITGRRREEIEPRSGGTPRVKLRFEHGGVTYDLEKTFKGQQGRSELRVISGGRLEEFHDDDVESKLREILKLKDPGRGERGIEHLGVWPLLWIDQGAGGLPIDKNVLNDESRTALGERLSKLSSEVLGGALGDRALALVREECLRFFAKQGDETTKAGAPLAEARRELAAAEESLAELCHQRDEADSDLETLQRIDNEMRRAAESRPGRAREVDEARKRVDAIDAMERARATLEMEASGARSDAELARERDKQRKKKRRAVATRADAISQSSNREQAMAAALAAHAALAPALASGFDAANRRLEDAERALARLNGDRRRAEARERLRRETIARDKARGAAEAVRALEAELKANPATPAWRKKLDRAREAALATRNRLLGAAARVTIAAERKIDLESRDGVRSLAAGEVVVSDVTESLELRVPGILKLTVYAGGEDLAAMRTECARSEEEVAKLLAGAELPSLEAADSSIARRESTSQALAIANDRLANAAPDGIEPLEQAVAEASAELAECARSLGVDPVEVEADTDAVAGSEVSADAVAEAESSVAVAREAERTARDAIAAHELHRATLDGEARAASESRARDESESRRLAAEIEEDVARDGDDATLAAAANAASEKLGRSETTLAQVVAGLRGVDAAGARSEMDRKASALDALDQNVLQWKEQHSRIMAVLERGAHLGISDRVAAAEARAGAARADVARHERAAAAAKLLLSTLEGCRDAARRRFLAPLEERARPLLAALFPGAKLEFDDEFGVAALERDGRSGEPFAPLSGGCREQVALIARLAMAEVLAADEPLLVLLDEALSQTDDQRLDRMLAVLFRCAKRLQIVVTTSQPRRWEKLGAANVIDIVAAAPSRNP